MFVAFVSPAPSVPTGPLHRMVSVIRSAFVAGIGVFPKRVPKRDAAASKGDRATALRKGQTPGQHPSAVTKALGAKLRRRYRLLLGSTVASLLSPGRIQAADTLADTLAEMQAPAGRRDAPVKESENRPVAGYLLNNNVWGREKSPQGWQTIEAITADAKLAWTVRYDWPAGLDAHSVKSYPSVVTGWQWGLWSTDGRLPLAVSQLGRVESGGTATLDKPGVQNLAYDLWFHASAPVRGEDKPSDELMVWMGRHGGAGPLGTLREKVQIDGTTWSLYVGDIGWKVFSFVREANATSWRVDLKAFIDHLVREGLMPETRQLSSVQFGTEVFSSPGEARLQVSDYFVEIDPRTSGDDSRPSDQSAVRYGTSQLVENGDSPETIVAKAAHVLPRPNQTAWMRLERTFFLHFGMNTFRGVEWGNGHEDPAIFRPSALDAKQWVQAVKSAGGRMIILVSKHHDGFCMWPTRYTKHSVVSAPWLDGKGDLVRAVADAARAEGIKLGLYLSPADLYQLRTNPQNPAGYYGNGSNKVLSVIPTDPAHFQKAPARSRTPAPGFTTYTYDVDDYNRYFLNQLYELLTEYGPISDVWFDGANPDPSVPETYDYAAWYDLIRNLQPDAVISVKGPDVRWVGNEGGYGRTTEWSVLPLSQPPERFTWPDMQAQDLGSRAKLTPGAHLWWYPAEVNTPILNGWFWSPAKRPKSPAELVDYFYRSVGRSGNMLLNLSPDNRGLIPDDQLASLHKMADVINDTFAHDLAAGATLTADASAPDHPPARARDGDLDTWWEAAPGHSTATFTLALPAAATFDIVSLQEAVAHRSQRIESFVIETWDGSAWTAPATVDEQTTVGHKRLERLAVPVTTDRVRIRITGSRLEPTLAEVGLFKQALPLAPEISERTRDGFVRLSHPHALPLVYTLDGREPAAGSAVYHGPIALPDGGTIKAAVLTADHRIGLVAGKTIVGAAPAGWTARATPSGDATKAIDADARTLWETHVAADAAPADRPSLTVDMGAPRRIAGFAYLPRQDWNFRGVVDRYRFETSLDGEHWTTRIEAGEFGNIKNNPMLQEVSFAPFEARYFRFTPLRDVQQSGWAHVAEITVLPAR